MRNSIESTISRKAETSNAVAHTGEVELSITLADSAQGEVLGLSILDGNVQRETLPQYRMKSKRKKAERNLLPSWAAQERTLQRD